MRNKVGVNTLRKHYGGNQRNGTNTEHNRLAAGKNIRYCLLQLEAAGLVGMVKLEFEDTDKKVKHVTMGKSLTKKGITDMDRIASQLVKELKKKWAQVQSLMSLRQLIWEYDIEARDLSKSKKINWKKVLIYLHQSHVIALGANHQ